MPGSDPPGVPRAPPAEFWALVLRRSRGYAHRIGRPAAGREPDREEDP